VNGPVGLHAILVGDGDVPAKADLDAAWPAWDAAVGLVVAADGGATKCDAVGLRPDLVVGDGDSLRADAIAALRASGIPVELSSPAKDESDLELAALAAVARGATRVTVLGALGGPRFDHALANTWLLAHPALGRLRTVLLDATTRVRLVDASAAPARAELEGRPGDLVTLLPFGETVTAVRTAGLAYALRGEPLRAGPARGLSNVRTGRRAGVSIDAGRLLVIETHVARGDQR
jgi:thiamine pyrophosphokinase